MESTLDMNRLPQDGGMPYTETNLDNLFPEPLNAVTSLFFLALAAYWFWKLKGEYRSHVYLTFSVFLLTIGAVGGSIYHGLRKWPVFIMMDWLPIVLLCVFTGVYFVSRLTRWFVGGLLVLGYGIFQYFIRQQLVTGSDVQLFLNVNYFVLAMLILFPTLAFLWKNKFEHGKWVGFALVAFLFALSFRVLDDFALVSTGTHFLWHTFGAVAAFCMLQFVYLVNRKLPTDAPVLA